MTTVSVQQWLFHLFSAAAIYLLILALMMVIEVIFKKQMKASRKRTIWKYVLISACLIWPLSFTAEIPLPYYQVIEAVRLPRINQQTLSLELVEESVDRYQTFANNNDTNGAVHSSYTQEEQASIISSLFPNLRRDFSLPLKNYLPTAQMIYLLGFAATILLLVLKRWHTWSLARKGRLADGSLKVKEEDIHIKTDLSDAHFKMSRQQQALAAPDRKAAILRWKIIMNQWRDALKLYRHGSLRFTDQAGWTDHSLDQKIKDAVMKQLVLKNRNPEAHDYPDYWLNKPQVKAFPAISLYRLHHPDIIMSILFVIARTLFWFLPVWTWLRKKYENDLQEYTIEIISQRFRQFYKEHPLSDSDITNVQDHSILPQTHQDQKSVVHTKSDQPFSLLARIKRFKGKHAVSLIFHVIGVSLLTLTLLQNPLNIDPSIHRITSDRMISEGWTLAVHGQSRQTAAAADSNTSVIDHLQDNEANQPAVIQTLYGNKSGYYEATPSNLESMQLHTHHVLHHQHDLFINHYSYDPPQASGPYRIMVEKWDENQSIEWSFNLNRDDLLETTGIAGIHQAYLQDSYLNETTGYYLLLRVQPIEAISYRPAESDHFIWLHLDQTDGHLIEVRLLEKPADSFENSIILANGDLLLIRYERKEPALFDDLDNVPVHYLHIYPTLIRYNRLGDIVWKMDEHESSPDVPSPISDLKLIEWQTLRYEKTISTVAADPDGGFYLTTNESWTVMMLDPDQSSENEALQQVLAEQDLAVDDRPLFQYHLFFNDSRLIHLDQSGDIILDQSLNRSRVTHFRPLISEVEKDGSIYLAGNLTYKQSFYHQASIFDTFYHQSVIDWSDPDLFQADSDILSYREAFTTAQVIVFAPDGQISWRQTEADQLSTSIQDMAIDQEGVTVLLSSIDPHQKNALAGPLQSYKANVFRMIRYTHEGERSARLDLPANSQSPQQRNPFIYLSGKTLYLNHYQIDLIQHEISRQETETDRSSDALPGQNERDDADPFQGPESFQ